LRATIAYRRDHDAERAAGAMDLAGAEQSHRHALRRTQLGAFAFLLLAGALLIGSLLLPLWDSRWEVTHPVSGAALIADGNQR
jgi:hypothetical protein